MRLCAAGILLLFITAGCGRNAAPTAVQPSESVSPLQRPEQPTAQNTSTFPEGRGVDLRMFSSDVTLSKSRKPTFWVHADVFSFDEKERQYSLENLRAVIYGQKEDNEEILLEAGKGRYQDVDEADGRGAKQAYLREGVVARVGTMKMDLTDIEWINDEMMAKTDNPVSISTEDSTLQASGMRIYPDDKRLILTDVKGTIRFERKQP